MVEVKGRLRGAWPCAGTGPGSSLSSNVAGYSPSHLHLPLSISSLIFRSSRRPISRNGSLGRRSYDVARSDVERGAVQGTGHFMARKLSFGKGSAPVRARVVRREDLAIDAGAFPASVNA